MSEDKKVITRFAPSPTGFLHIGNYRTAVFSYLYARQNNGEFILRIEDTDKERSKKEYEDNIIESLQWLGLNYDHFYRQSEQLPSHKRYLDKMISDGYAYISKEEAKDGSGVVKEIVRFKNPNKDVTFSDMIRGDITMNTTDLGDFVIARSIDEPLFHFAVVIDDMEEGVTHIIRGEDHVSNTPRQILIWEALGKTPPRYAHLPLVLSPDRSKLSKRKGALAISEYKSMGYLPQSLLNSMSLIGWHPSDDVDILSMGDLIEKFSIEKIQKAGAIFDQAKLDWINKEHIKNLSSEEKLDYSRKFLPEDFLGREEYSDNKLYRALPLIFERVTHFGELRSMADAGELDYFFWQPKYDPSQLAWKDEPVENSKQHLERVLSILGTADDKKDEEYYKGLIFPYAEEVGRGSVLWPLRVSLSGLSKSPDPFTLLALLDKDESMSRIRHAIGLIS